MKGIFYEGNTVYENGKILNCRGRELRECANGRIYYTYKGRRISRTRARIVYEALSGETVKTTDVVEFKDNNSHNCAFANLVLVPCALHRANTAYARHKRFTPEEASIIENEYRLFRTPLRRLAEKYKCSLVTVCRIVKGEYLQK